MKPPIPTYRVLGTHARGFFSDGLEEETGFVWYGSHLLQEVQPDGRYTYIHTDTAREDRHTRQSVVVRRIHRLGSSKKRWSALQECAPALPIAKHPCPHWHVATSKMDGILIQKRNNGNGAFSWKSYKDNVTVPHRK